MSERKNRDRLIIATKVGSQMGTDVNARGLSRQHILAALLCKAHRGRFSHMSEARGDQLRPAHSAGQRELLDGVSRKRTPGRYERQHD